MLFTPAISEHEFSQTSCRGYQQSYTRAKYSVVMVLNVWPEISLQALGSVVLQWTAFSRPQPQVKKTIRSSPYSVSEKRGEDTYIERERERATNRCHVTAQLLYSQVALTSDILTSSSPCVV